MMVVIMTKQNTPSIVVKEIAEMFKYSSVIQIWIWYIY